MTRTTSIDGYECFDSEGSLALQIGGDDVLHLRRVTSDGATHGITDEQHDAVNDAVLAALGLADNPLLVSLRAILPYAESRAEDMADSAEQDEGTAKLAPTALQMAARARTSRELADKAVAAVDAAKALLASLDAGG